MLASQKVKTMWIECPSTMLKQTKPIILYVILNPLDKNWYVKDELVKEQYKGI